jgi:D-alanyl-D-alanine carboxypeptidase
MAGCFPITPPAGGNSGTELQKALNAFVSQAGGPPGMVVAIGRGSQFELRTAGVANIVTEVKPAANDQMRLASVAKAFSGAAALSLVSRGQLKLSDTVGKLLTGMPAEWKNVTLSQLLGHTSGVPDFSKSPGFGPALLESLQKAPPPRTLLSYITEPALINPTRYHYSNSDNILVGLMIQSVTHHSYEGVLATNVFGPLHLTHTSLPRTSAIDNPTLRGYDLKPPVEDVTRLFAAGWTWASGGVVSTPDDALRFIRGYVSGALENRSTRAAQFTFRPGNSEPPGPGVNSAGLALFKYVTGCGTVYGHTGNTSGYTQFVASSADGRRAVTVSVNAQISPTSNETLLPELRHIFELAVCASK